MQGDARNASPEGGSGLRSALARRAWELALRREGESDALGMDRIPAQAKRFDAGVPVGAGAVRDFFGALTRAKAEKGVFATTSLFTAEARETAAALPKPIVLLDGPTLARLMIRHEVGCRVEARYAVAAIDEAFFAAARRAKRVGAGVLPLPRRSTSAGGAGRARLAAMPRRTSGVAQVRLPRKRWIAAA